MNQGQPVGFQHPFVTPWAKAQKTPTAELYASTQRRAAVAAARAAGEDPPPAPARPWQVRVPLTPQVVRSSQSARYAAHLARKVHEAALAEVRRLERQEVPLRAVFDDAGNKIGAVFDEEALEKIQKALKEARAKVPKATKPRAQRRRQWRAARAADNKNRLEANREVRAAGGDDVEALTVARFAGSQLWRDSWAPLKGGV